MKNITKGIIAACAGTAVGIVMSKFLEEKRKEIFEVSYDDEDMETCYISIPSDVKEKFLKKTNDVDRTMRILLTEEIFDHGDAGRAADDPSYKKALRKLEKDSDIEYKIPAFLKEELKKYAEEKKMSAAEIQRELIYKFGAL